MVIDDAANFDEIFFKNNGETDLLTGSIAPNLFNQIVQRDINLSERSNAPLSIISLTLNLAKIIAESDHKQLKNVLENELIRIYFELNKFFRNSDCICRISQLGFWILVNGLDPKSTIQIKDRLINTLPDFVEIAISHHKQGQNLIDWFSEVDKVHFKDNNK